MESSAAVPPRFRAPNLEFSADCIKSSIARGRSNHRDRGQPHDEKSSQEKPLLPCRKSLEDRLRFETLMSEISARFVNLPADRIDSEVEDAQRRICELLGLDRFSLMQTSEEEPGTLCLTHFHDATGATAVPAGINVNELFPWSARKILNRETVPISRGLTFREADRDRGISARMAPGLPGSSLRR
jgi:hypothetical protein